MKRRKQIGKLIYTPRWGQGDVQLGEDYEGLSREDKLEVLSYWISELLSMRNAMIPNSKSWHHFMGDKSWYGLTDDEILNFQDIVPNTLGYDLIEFAHAIEAKLKDKNA
jgi:hypothetical protein